MPLSKYFKGRGEAVMKDMTKRYGAEKGKSVFYATANKRGLDAGPSKGVKKKRGVK